MIGSIFRHPNRGKSGIMGNFYCSGMATQVFLKGSEVLYQKNQEWSLYINFFTGPCGRAWTISKNLSGKYSQKLLDHAKQSLTDAFKIASKRAIQKQQKELMIWLVIKFLIKSKKFQKIHNKIIQTQSQMRTKTKYLKKYMHLQKRDRKLLIKWD